MNFLHELGLGSICDDEDFFMRVAQYTLENGKFIRGYYGGYIWLRNGYVELNFHVKPEHDRNTISGFTSNVSGDQMWQLAVSDDGEIFEEEKQDDGYIDPMYHVISFTHPLTHKDHVIIHVVNSDAVPDFDQDDVYTLQVVAIAEKPKYYADYDAYHADPLATIMGKPMYFREDFVTNFMNGSLVVGKVLRVGKRFADDMHGNRIYFYAIEVNTQFGILEIMHTEDAVDEDDRSLIKEGSYIKTQCTILGDVAVGKYQNGAIFDLEHIIRRLNYCYNASSFETLYKLLAPGCKLISRYDEIAANGAAEVLALLEAEMRRTEGRGDKIHAIPAKLEGYDHPEGTPLPAYEHPIGTPCLAVSHTKSGIDTFIFIHLNENNRIDEILSAGEKYGDYHIALKQYHKYEKEEFTPVNLSHSESEWLEIIRDRYTEGNFDDIKFYYGMSPDCRISSTIDPHHCKNVRGREELFTYLSVPITQGQHEITAKIIDGSHWGHANALSVVIDGEERIITLDVDDKGLISMFHERNSE